MTRALRREVERAVVVAAAVGLCACEGPTLELGQNSTIDVAVSDSNATESGISGRLQEYLGTSFQPADWQYAFFRSGKDNASGRVSQLSVLAPHRIRVQLMDGGAIPWRSQGATDSSDEWDFTELDALLSPLLQLGDVDVELQIAAAPSFAGSGTSIDAQVFAKYAARLVQYYNKTGGFTVGAKTFASPVSSHIDWWSILSDPNSQGLSPEDYATLYDAVVSEMRKVDETIHVSAPELAVSNRLKDPVPTSWLQSFAALEHAQRIDAVSVHIYGTDARTEPDASVFERVSAYAAQVRQVSAALADTSLAGLPVRVTQNNVNADAPVQGEVSTDCWVSSSDWSKQFKVDARGTSQFFAAYRPYVFSQFGKAGSRALYHWLYTAGHCEPGSTYCSPDLSSKCGLDTDDQNAEVNYVTGEPYRSYWVDDWLGRMFPVSDDGPGDLILDTSAVDESTREADSSVEVLAVSRVDGTIVVMLVNHALSSEQDNDGSGAARSVLVDLSPLLATRDLRSASLLVLDAEVGLDALAALLPRAVPVQARTLVRLAGYGVAFLVLSPLDVLSF